MKRVLSRTVALICSAGLSFCLATNPFGDEPKRQATHPLITLDIFMNNLFPKEESDTRDFNPTALRELPSDLIEFRPSSPSEIRWIQAALEEQQIRSTYLSRLQTLKKRYDNEKKVVEDEQTNLEKTLKEKQATIDAYQSYLQKPHILSAYTSSRNAQETLMLHVAYLEGQLEHRPISSNQNQEEREEINKTILLLKNNPEVLQQEICDISEKLASTTQKLEKLHFGEVKEAQDILRQMLWLKLATFVDLKKCGRPFDNDTLITLAEVRVILMEMGIPRFILDDPKLILPQTLLAEEPKLTLSKVLLAKASENTLWPAFFMPAPADNQLELKKALNIGGSDIPENSQDFLKELKARTQLAIDRVQENYEQHIRGMVTLLSLMEQHKIPLQIEGCLSNELYTRLIPEAVHTKLKNSRSLFLESLLTDPVEGLFKGIKLSQGIKERALTKLRENMKLNAATALMLLTRGIESTPTVSTKLSSRILPSIQGVEEIVLLEEGQQPDPGIVNKHLAQSLVEAIFDRFNASLLDMVAAHLVDVLDNK